MNQLHARVPANAIALFAVLVAVSIVIGIFVHLDYNTANNPPQWYLDRHATSDALRDQKEPLAQFVVSQDWLDGQYIPPNLTVEAGGDGVVIRGPRQDIYEFHRKIYGLDNPRRGVYGFVWRTHGD